jgi:CubicO group peptidase (beta-lactamase class C family)
MHAALITKQVVAPLAAQAVLAGVLDVDTAARAVLPALPGWAGEVRVRHLVHHTAGCRAPVGSWRLSA